VNLYADNDGRFPDDADVHVRYPLTDDQHHGDRATWPWVNGYIAGQCGPDEWDVCVTGAEPVDQDDDGGPLYPLVFRDASELRLTGLHAAVARIAEQSAEQEDEA
jgi:hypothetical protein